MTTPATLLTITPLSGNITPTLTPFSLRGITQTLEQVVGASGGGSAFGSWIRRDIQFSLINFSNPQFRKYSSVVSCSDTETPALDNAWVGETVLVDCAAELSFPVGGSPARPVVSGSERTESGFTYYRPSLTMMILSIKNVFNEWQAKYNWQIEMQEI